MNIFVSPDSINNVDDVELTLDEYEDRFVIHGKITGVVGNSININYQQEHMTVIFTREVKQSVGNQWTNISIQQSKVENKTFHVPNIDPMKVSASYENEMLNIIMMKNQLDNKIDDLVEIIDVDDYYDV